MAIMRWFPFGDVDEMERAKRARAAQRESRERKWRPGVDVKEEEELILLKVELPGVAPEEVSISVDDDVLTIRGERKPDIVGKGCFYCSEREFGQFERAFVLPKTVEPTDIKAESKDGVLLLKLPKKAETKPRKIEISVS